jgi:hypothetical protein
MHIRIEVTEHWRVAEAITPLMNLWEYYHTECFDPDHWSVDRVHQNMTEDNDHGNYFVSALMIPTVEYCLATGIEVDSLILDWIKECRWRAQCVVDMLQSMKDQKNREMDIAIESGEEYSSRYWHQVDGDLHEAKQMVEAFTLDPDAYKGAEKVEIPEELA